MRSDDWEQLPYFLAVARHGSLRTAAEGLGSAHGTVKRHIEALENSYGVQLFRRTRRGLNLTAAGQRLVPVAEEAENVIAAGRSRMTGLDRGESGSLRFSLTGTMAYDIVAPILVRFFEAYPGIDVELRVTDRMEDITRLETDVSLRYANDIRDDVVARRLFRMSLQTLASRDYLERHLPHAGEGGAGLHWIGWDEVNPSPEWLAQSEFPKADVRHATTDTVMQLNLARQGFGMIRTSGYFATIYPELIAVPGTVALPDRSLWVLLHSELRRTTRVRRFVEFLSNELLRLRPLLQG